MSFVNNKTLKVQKKFSKGCKEEYYVHQEQNMTKDLNPPKSSQSHPIKTFWASLESKVYQGDFQAKIWADPVKRIKLC